MNSEVARNCTGPLCGLSDPVRGGTIAGGGGNTPIRVTDAWGFIGGGDGNTAGNDDADHDNAGFAVVAGGRSNEAIGSASTVGGGSGNRAGGAASTVPGGEGNTADGSGAFAAGTFARANAVGCFVWADRTSISAVAAQCNDEGCTIAAGGGAWSCSSSREIKYDFADIDPAAVLDRVVAMPIATWRYRDEKSGARHMGPTAENFHAAFGLGDSAQNIGLLDGHGVALAAIQGLNARVEAQAREIAALKAALAAALERLPK